MTGLVGAASASPSAFWYLTRGSGIVTLVLLTVSVSLGVLTSVRWRSRGVPRFVVAGLHRNLTLLAVVFLALHVGTTIADGFTPIGVKDVFIPFVAAYRPFWLGLGALSTDLLAAVIVTSLLRARFGFRTWRTVHWLAYASWPLALLHSLGTGSDARLSWMAALGLACVAAVTFSALVRVGYGGGSVRVRSAGGIAALVVPVALIVWYQGGPARHGWAARAGTPAAILQPHTVAVSLRRAQPPVPKLPATFNARLSGRMTQSGPDAGGLIGVRIDAAVQGRVQGKIRLVLRGDPTEGGGVSMTASGVAFAASGVPAVYEGSIVGLNGDLVVARVSAPEVGSVELRLSLRLNASTGAVSGRIHGVSSRRAQ